MSSSRQTSIERDTPARRVIDLELLVLDLTRCTRCAGTLENVERAIDIVRPSLEAMGAQVRLGAVLIESEEQAHEYRLVTSPALRINGRDIVSETLESECDSCTDICGCEGNINCRVWRYHGQDYTEVPVGLVVGSILREALGTGSQLAGDAPEYLGVPENLRSFFRGKTGASGTTEPCCAPAERGVCCDWNENMPVG